MTLERFQNILYTGLYKEDEVGKSMEAIAKENQISIENLNHIYRFVGSTPGSPESAAAWEIIKEDISRNRPEGMTDIEEEKAWKAFTDKAKQQIDDLEAKWGEALIQRNKYREELTAIQSKQDEALQEIGKTRKELQALSKSIETETDAQKRELLQVEYAETQKKLARVNDEYGNYDKIIGFMKEDLSTSEMALAKATRAYEAALLVYSLPETAERAAKNAPKMEAGWEKGEVLKSQVDDLAQSYTKAASIFKRAGQELSYLIQDATYDVVHAVEQRVNERRLHKEILAARPSLTERFASEWHTHKALKQIKSLNKLEQRIHKTEERKQRDIILKAKREFRKAHIGRFDVAAFKKSPEYKKALEDALGDLNAQKQEMKAELKKTLAEIQEISVKRTEKYIDLSVKRMDMKELDEIRDNISFADDLAKVRYQFNDNLKAAFKNGSGTIKQAFEESGLDEVEMEIER